MKKYLVIITFLILSFILHIFYMGYINENLFQKIIQNDYKHYQISNIQFQKGFLKSNANLIISNQSYPDILIQINFKFNNIFFTNQIIEGELSNPFNFLEHSLKDNKLASFTIKLNDNAQLFIKIKDINASNKDGDTKIYSGTIQADMNKNLEIENIQIHFNQIDFSQFYTKFILQNFHYKQIFETPLKIYDLHLLNSSEQEISFDYLLFDEHKINSFYTKNHLKIQQDNTMFSLNMQGKSNEIDIDFKHLFSQNFNFEKTKFNIILSQKLDQDYDFLNFFNTKTNLKIQNLIFEKNKQTISTQGDLSIDNNIYQANLQIITSDEPDNIFIWAKNYGGLNQYFFKDNDLFISNLIYNNSLNPQLKINGNEFLNLD